MCMQCNLKSEKRFYKKDTILIDEGYVLCYVVKKEMNEARIILSACTCFMAGRAGKCAHSAQANVLSLAEFETFREA